MTFDREEFNRLNGTRSREVQELHYRSLAQAEVKAQNLTGNEYWDYFLSILQEMVKIHDGNIVACRLILDSPDVLDYETLLKAKMDLNCEAARKSTLEGIMGLPKDMMEKGNKAGELLAEMERLGT